MEGQMFLVSAVLNPVNKDIEEKNAISEIILQPKPIMARDERDAGIRVIMDSEELKGHDRERIEVIVRPF